MQRIVEEFGGTPEAVEADRLVADLDVRHAQAADDELKSALAASKHLASTGRFDPARSVLRLVGTRHEGTMWFRARGEAAVTEASGAEAVAS